MLQTVAPGRRAGFIPALVAGIALLAGGGLAVASPAPDARFSPDVAEDEAVAIFAGGCFWCMEEVYQETDGVVEVISGFTGGSVDEPTYRQVTGGDTGHVEAVKVVYKPAEVSYDRLLELFWHNIDPTDDGGQFCDRGSSYRSELFYVDAEQEQAAKASKQALVDAEDAPEPIVTEISPATTFYAAEESHQDYYVKNSLRYKFYKNSCRRQATLERVWGDQAGG